MAGGFLNTLRNTYKFFATTPATGRLRGPRRERPLVDRWLLSRLDATVEPVDAAWEGYDPTGGARDHGLRGRRPVQLVRAAQPARFWASDADADPAALATLHEALVTVSRLLAPAAPFAERLAAPRAGGNLGAPRPVPVRRDVATSARGGDGRGAPARVAGPRRARRRKLGVRQPLAGCRWRCPAAARGPPLDALLELLRLEVNVKRWRSSRPTPSWCGSAPRPNFRSSASGTASGRRRRRRRGAAQPRPAARPRAGTPAELERWTASASRSCPRT